MEEAASIDIAVIRAFTAGLTGTGKLLIISSSTGLVGDTRDALPTEDMPVDTTVLAATERSKCERVSDPSCSQLIYGHCDTV